MAATPFVLRPALVAIANDYQGVNRALRGFIADRVAPRVRVDSRSFYWWQSRLNEAFTTYDNQMSRESKANEIRTHWDEQTGSTLDYGLREPVLFADEAQAQSQKIPFTLKSRAVKHIQDTNDLNREIRVANMAMSLSSYSAGYSTDLSAGTKWSDFNNSDPVALITDAMAGMLIPGTIGVTSLKVMNILRRHPAVSKALGGSQDSGRYIPKAEIAALFGLQDIVVGNTIKQTSNRGQTLVTSQIWPDSFAIHANYGSPDYAIGDDVRQPNFLTTFQWGDRVVSEKLYEPGELGLWGGVKVFNGESIVEKQVNPYGGYLFNAVL